MKRVLMLLFLSVAAIAGAQTYTIPQATTPATVFNGVSTAQASGCLANQGQNMYFLFYSAGGATGNPTGVQIRLEGSFNSDAATCATGTWIPISDDGVEPGQNGTNLVLAIGPFPYIRANLVKCVTCDASNTITANFFGTSSAPGNPFGAYGAGQQLRKVQWIGQTGNVLTPTPIVGPYGSSAGFVFMSTTGANFTGGTLSAVCLDPNGQTLVSAVIPTTTNVFIMPVPATSCNVVRAKCSGGCSVSSGTHSAFYFFYPPGGAAPATIQPASTSNTETTAVNATASKTLTVAAGQRAHVFSVSGRCSAGTAGLTVADGATTIWSSGTTEVGTTTFNKAWNPGLASSPGNNLVISLTTCGAANTGTLDVQGTVGP